MPLLEADLRNSEMVFGIVSPLGTPLDLIEAALTQRLALHGYRMGLTVRISSLLAERERLDPSLRPEARQEQLMDAGNRLRAEFGGGYLATLAVAATYAWRDEAGAGPAAATAHLVRSLKHPDEVARLRDVYGRGFFLIGVSAPRDERRARLIEHDFPNSEAERLLHKDSAEASPTGQQTRDTFHLADAYVRVVRGREHEAQREIERLVDLLMSHPFLPPTRDEYAMFMAHSAALRSADLSRQVGAVIVGVTGDLIATGANDAPAAGGGPYWPNAADYWPAVHPRGGPDHVRGHDSNERERDAIVARVIRALVPEAQHVDDQMLVIRHGDQLLETGMLDLTEFGRAVHAEMAALTACTRTSVTALGGTLFCTTFPCHNCTKHIVDAGIVRVVFIEPYPKSKARALHDDAIFLADEGGVAPGKAVTFEPFVGVGPRRFTDLFSMTLGSGRAIRRKRKNTSGARLDWRPGADSATRLPLDPRSYLEREKAASEEVDRRERRRGTLLPATDDHGPDPETRR